MLSEDVETVASNPQNSKYQIEVGKMVHEKTVVVFSGGMDSTVCLAWAKNRFEKVYALTFFYGQRHSVEVDVAREIARELRIDWRTVDISFLPDLVTSALVSSDGNVNENHPDNKNLPASFVPNRNILFLTIGHAYAQKVGALSVVIGANQVDYSGYPDCRLNFMHKMEDALNTGSEQNITIITPLINRTKADIFEMAAREGVLDIVLKRSMTCYNGVQEMNDWGMGCGQCPACILRKKGWDEFQAKGNN